jgi:branched-chain amino acid transport system ATP-binding protein
MTPSQPPLLAVQKLEAWYGRSHILQGIDLEVHAGEIVCLIGRNGAGKTTIMRSIMGLMGRTRGSVLFDGVSLLGLPPHRRFHQGLAYVFEERRIVPGLTVLENLREPLLEARKGLRHLVDQLLLARAMVAHPKLVMLDEPSEGIMPVLVDEMFALFAAWKRAGKTLLLVEQNVELALSIADRAYIVDQGCIAHHAAAAELLADREIQERYCSV